MLTKSRYIRKSPKGDESIVIIKTDEEVKYHEDLLKEGFEYREIRVSQPPADACPSCSS
jgi:hypothetical protein